jgi:hypothetical protein
MYLKSIATPNSFRGTSHNWRGGEEGEREREKEREKR